MENYQENYEELKRKSELTEKFIKMVNKLNLDDREIPKTEKGMDSKAKELLDKLSKKMEKEDKEEIKNIKKIKKEKKGRKY